MKKSIITLLVAKTVAIIGIICLIGMLSSCSTCSANKWRKKRYVYTEPIMNDSLPQFVVENNQIIMFK